MTPRYKTIEKRVGETPLEATERLRAELNLPKEVPMAYAGRLDPMAEGKLLILIGDECKQQQKYHHLDKEYEFTVLFGVKSDTADVLGLVEYYAQSKISDQDVQQATRFLVGAVDLPYPHFSSKTVDGKPLHTWALEGRLDEIEIPTKRSRIYSLTHTRTKNILKKELVNGVRDKIDLVTPVTDASKALGRDFRRRDVLASWEKIAEAGPDEFTLATFTCISSSGTYMRTLAEKIAEHLGTCGLACDIKRTTIGKYLPLFGQYGFFTKKY